MVDEVPTPSLSYDEYLEFAKWSHWHTVVGARKWNRLTTSYTEDYAVFLDLFRDGDEDLIRALALYSLLK